MKDICNPSECTGCMACVNSCAHHAISIVQDKEGFDRPHIDENLCVDCGLCQRTCPINEHPMVNEPKKVLSGWSSDESVRLGSSSGGAFTEIARPILEEGGVVFGCALNNRLQAEHTYVETLEDLTRKLCGSKYVQSRIGNSYAQAKEFLKQGRKVLFSGTPCQIAGLKNFLRKDYENLMTVDLICHGVPSPMIFEDYKQYMEERENMELMDIKFRCKKSSWIFFNMTLTGHIEKSGALKTYYGRYYEDPYIRGFLRDYFLRPSCHQCHFTSTKRCSDFTIADWWGYKKESQVDKDFRRKGVSLVLVNTEKAMSLLASLKMILKGRTIEEGKKTNCSLSKAFAIPKVRETFWMDYAKMPFKEVVSKYMKPEKVRWQVQMMERYQNTDNIIMLIRILELPQRVFNKFTKIIRIISFNYEYIKEN